jgi:hypothetical protein
MLVFAICLFCFRISSIFGSQNPLIPACVRSTLTFPHNYRLLVSKGAFEIIRLLAIVKPDLQPGIAVSIECFLFGCT